MSPGAGFLSNFAKIFCRDREFDCLKKNPLGCWCLELTDALDSALGQVHLHETVNSNVDVVGSVNNNKDKTLWMGNVNGRKFTEKKEGGEKE